MVGPVIVLNLILPTADIVSDLLTVIKLYVGAYGCYRSDLVLEQYNACENNPMEYCTNSTSTIGEQHQHAWCQLSGDNETYTCNGFHNLWKKCRANPRGFNEDPENVDAPFTHGILRHPKFATILLGKLQTHITNQKKGYIYEIHSFHYIYIFYSVFCSVPFVLSYLMSFFIWLKLEKNKKSTFLFALFSLYPQLGKGNSM